MKESQPNGTCLEDAGFPSHDEMTQYNTNIVSPDKEEIVHSNIPAGELMNKRDLSSDSSVEDVKNFSKGRKMLVPLSE